MFNSIEELVGSGKQAPQWGFSFYSKKSPPTSNLDVAWMAQITASPVIPLCCMSYVGAAMFWHTVAPVGGHKGWVPAKEETNPSADYQGPSPGV